MQKKILFLATLLISQTAFSQNMPFTGLYGAMNFGWMNEIVEVDQNSTFLVSFIAENQQTDSKLRANSITGGIGLGYGYPIKEIGVVGLEARGDIESLTAEYETHQHPINITELSTQFNSNAKVKLERDFSLLAKVGLLLQPNTLLYGLGGVSWGFFNMSSGANGTLWVDTIGGILPASGSAPATDEGYETGWLAGIGIEHVITKNVTIGLEYTHADYGDLDFPSQSTGSISILGTPLVSSIVNQTKFNAETNNILLKLNYYIS